ncbi:MAG: UPF0182 family protein [Actinobacteria bacterium]|nr:UPF0182 family protein [Actinomycetota bacterium]
MPEEKFPWDSIFRGGGGDGGGFPGLFRGKADKRPSSGLRDRWNSIKPRTKWIAGVVILVLAVLILSASWLSTFYTDLLWYEEVGYTSVFWKRIVTQIWLFFAFGLLFFAIFYGNIWLARRLVPRYERPAETPSPVEESLANFRERAGKWLDRGLVAFSALVSFIVGWASAAQWEKALIFFNHAPFGKTDPIFGKDIGYYVFEYPFLRYFVGWLITSLIFIIIVTAAVHFLYGAISFSAGRGRKFATHVKVHLSVLAAVTLMVQAWSFRLDMLGLLYSPRGTVTGASYTDVHAQIPAYWILIAACLACAGLFLLNIRYKGWKLPLAGVVGIVVVALLAGSLYPLIVQNYVVKPKELAREREYIGYNIEFTQDAYSIQDEGEEADVEKRLFPADLNLTYEDVVANAATIGNVRLWDPRLIKQVFMQRQELRQLYDFNDVDVDRYTVFDGRYTQMLVAGRELVIDKLREDARTWQNTRLSYTHGYGLVMAPSNRKTKEGDPELAVKDIPPVSQEGLGIEITRPELYYGELAHDYVAVRTGAEEIDYPLESGNKLVEPYYEGQGGVQVSNFLKRLAFSIRNRDITFLFSGYITGETRLMFRRNIKDRALEVAPFLTLDGDPYLVVTDDGRQKWILDAYTTSDLYPYSQYYNQDFNYIRNSVKVVIDAYDGTLTYYLADPGDPVALTYGRIFPELFTPMEEMPEDIKRHLRYPEDLFSVQMEMYKTYHLNDVDSFYQKEDVWEVSTETYDVNQSQQVRPYYVIINLPGEEKEEMVLMLPFNPRGKSNMVDWVAARCDFPHYGKLINFSFPPGRLVNGTQQFESLVDQKTEISEQITLWNQAGSRVIRGNTLVIPIEGSLIYVEPLYLEATNPAIPQLKRVIVGYGDRVEMGETLEEALQAVFGAAPEPQPGPTPQPQPGPQPQPEGDLAELVRRANQLYGEAQAALRAGDWAAYGAKMDQLGQVLERMAALSGQP